MLKFIASMSLAALLSLSPAFAHETPTAPAAPNKCYPLASVLKRFPAEPLAQITAPADIAEFVANFNAYVAANGGPKKLLGEGTDIEQVILWPRPDDAVEYVTMVNGCAKTMGSFGLDAIETLVKPKSKEVTPDFTPTPTPPTKEQKNFTEGSKMKNPHPAFKDDGKI